MTMMTDPVNAYAANQGQAWAIPLRTAANAIDQRSKIIDEVNALRDNSLDIINASRHDLDSIFNFENIDLDSLHMPPQFQAHYSFRSSIPKYFQLTQDGQNQNQQ